MEDVIDLRSDTVTKPSPGMRQAIAEAEVGDDVHGEDPSINRLEETVAELTGKQAAMFVASGTMSNQICLRIHTQPGDEIIGEETCHVLNYEAGGPAVNSGCMTRLVKGERGVFDVSQLEGLIRPDDPHYPRTRLVCVENTHNRGNGRVFPIDKIEAISRWAHDNGLAMHLDGARLMNAVVASGIPARDWCRPFDTVSICFSKSLGAPVGSALACTNEMIYKARRVRKVFGGGWRQGGILAAAAVYALEHNVDRLAEDHANAKIIARAIADVPGFRLNVDDVETNLIWFEMRADYLTAEEVKDRLAENGVLIGSLGPRLARAVTHLDCSRHQAGRAADIIRRIFT